ncbi:MAG TPA: asparagine synthase-related protein, partial [Blastocatellia bacterium]
PVPVGSWLRGRFRHVVDEYVLGSRARSRGVFNPEFVESVVARHMAGENHAERLWSLVNFEIWQRRFIDGEAPRPVSRHEYEMTSAWPVVV